MTTTGLRIGRALEGAVTASLNKQGRRRGCRPMVWGFDALGPEQCTTAIRPVVALSGYAGALYDDAEAARVAEEWAAALGLARQLDRFGMRTWTGEVDGYAVTVWCVIDRAAFEGPADGERRAE